MTTPQNQVTPVILTEEEIKTKFEELGALADLSATCNRRNIKRSTNSLAQRKYTAERGVKFLRKTDGQCQAILYFWRTPDGGEDYRIVSFTAPDGTFYSTDIITHPSKLLS